MRIYVIRHGETKKNRMKSIKKRNSVCEQASLSDSVISSSSIADDLQSSSDPTLNLNLVLDSTQKSNSTLNLSVDLQISSQTDLLTELVTELVTDEMNTVSVEVSDPSDPEKTQSTKHHVLTRSTIEDADDKDSVLNKNGYLQCERTAEYIAEREFNPDKLDLTKKIRIFTSPVTRTVQSSVHIKNVMFETLVFIASLSTLSTSPNENETPGVFDQPVIELSQDVRLYDGVLDSSPVTRDRSFSRTEAGFDGLSKKEQDVIKLRDLKCLLNELYLSFTNEHEQVILLVTHNHVIELLYKMIEGDNGEKKKFHNSSISIIEMSGLIDVDELNTNTGCQKQEIYACLEESTACSDYITCADDQTECTQSTKTKQFDYKSILSGTWDFFDHIDHEDLIKNHQPHPIPSDKHNFGRGSISGSIRHDHKEQR
ncbi:hypothetical protein YASMINEVIRUS_699 [Yasminevirus sp. GU-2018]|uniref:Phosphoglycerate mutase family protein n=1 Tax=Yasminevirus sp. GU-2018 TaxID=2420051 RepID=A0A5K0UAV4_9VIRU|nr:hypothetical protein YASMINEVIRUS_699 [Yasminevirus sp. GU-2018]